MAFKVERFKVIASISIKALVTFLSEVLEMYGYENIHVDAENYIYAEGEINIGLVAHLDTVFCAPPEYIFHDPDECVIWSPDGLGADDRAGVEAILEILDAGLRPHIIFCLGEECGGVGAQKLAKDFRPQLNYLIEIDRAGVNDCVFYSCDNRDFVQYVEQFGFKEQMGSFSDITFLAPVWGCAAVNLSTGYFNEHSHTEYLDYSILECTICKIIAMLSDDEHKFEYIERIGGTCCDFCGGRLSVLKPYLIAGTNDRVYLCKACYNMLKEYTTND